MKKTFYIWPFVLLMMILVGCGSTNDSSSTANGTEQEVITVQHELGETLVNKYPEKVLVFDFGILDTLQALDIDVVGLPKDSLPSYLEAYNHEDYRNVGSLKEPDFEEIAAIDPDLIIISGRQATLYDQLEELAPTIHLGVDATRYIESFKENMETVGDVFGVEDEINERLQQIDQDIDALNEKASALNERALIILANDDKISAYGPNSRFGLIHDLFGVPAADENIEASTHGMNVSFEYVLELNPDILYVIDRTAAIGEGSTAEQLIENRLVEQTSAYENDKIFYLDPDYWYLSGGGLQSVQEMIRAIDDSLNEGE